MSKHAVKENYLEVGIIHQECPERVNLVPGKIFLNPIVRIFKWVLDIVKVNQSSRY